jgi:hypothetical protein
MSAMAPRRIVEALPSEALILYTIPSWFVSISAGFPPALTTSGAVRWPKYSVT